MIGKLDVLELLLQEIGLLHIQRQFVSFSPRILSLLLYAIFVIAHLLDVQITQLPFAHQILAQSRMFSRVCVTVSTHFQVLLKMRKSFALLRMIKMQ